jgi:hypothetical protein
LSVESRLTGARLMARGDCGADFGVSYDRRIGGLAGPQGFHDSLDHLGRRGHIRVADGQHDHVTARSGQFARPPVDRPRVGALAGDPVDQGRKPHHNRSLNMHAKA